MTGKDSNELIPYPETIQEIIRQGDRRKSLEAMRDYLGDALGPDADGMREPGYVLVRIVQQIREINKELATLDDGAGATEKANPDAPPTADEVRARREKRLKEAQAAHAASANM